jgi:hypothetical protein
LFFEPTQMESARPLYMLARLPLGPAAAVSLVLDPDASAAYQCFATELVIRESCGCLS